LKSYTERPAEIDRRVAQELKNNQDFINTTNQWLQKIDTALEKIKKEMQEHTNSVGSKIKTQDISFENLVTRNEAHKKLCNADLDEYRKQMAFCMEFVRESVSKSDEKFSILEECSTSINALYYQLDTLSIEISRLDQLITNEVIRLSNEINEKTSSIKNEILNLPSEIPEVRKTMIDQIKIFQVDFNGLFCEIEKIKKAAFVSSKHVEDLYTRIEQLKQVKQ